MDSPWIALLAFVIMLVAMAAGARIRRRWPEHHSNRETIELLQTIVMMLATFAAIVLGLLLTSAKSDFDELENDIRSLSSALVQLDFSLEDLGADGLPIRHQLARYLAAAIASTWTDQPPPTGNYYPQLSQSKALGYNENSPALGQLLERANSTIENLSTASAPAARAQQSSIRLMRVVLDARWRAVEASQGTLSSPFVMVLVFWLTMIFLCFGLSAPLNRLNAIVTALSALALASALFVIIDLSQPFTGSFTVSSYPARQALAEMLALPGGMPTTLAGSCPKSEPGC